MEEPIIQFFSEGVDFELNRQDDIRRWLERMAMNEKKTLSFLNYIFCDDEYLLELNRQYLGHDYYTDVIGFPFSEDDTTVEGDIFISIDRVADNAEAINIGFESELFRVMIHGLLHLMGYDDHDSKNKETMTRKEDECLGQLQTILYN